MKRYLSWAGVLFLAGCGLGRPVETASHGAAAASYEEEAPPPGGVEAMPVEPATSPHAPTGTNPFVGASFYVNPDWSRKVEAMAVAAPGSAAALKRLSATPTAQWLDSIASVDSVPRVLDDAAKQRGAGGEGALPVFVVYDLPNRDCSAKASAGELNLENGGEARYRTEFIDKIAAHFQAHPKQRIVAIIEPDSLGNLATNLNVDKCAVSERVYRASIAYAVAKLSLPNVYLYLDAAHSGWLGWDGNRQRIARVFKEVLAAAGGADRIRGFATNVSNYSVLKGDDGRRLNPSNPCSDEITYITKLAESLRAEGITDKGFIIDTSRNGRGGIRSRGGNWCNIRGAGLGERPRAAPEPLVDAYFWVKPPGDSDGTSDASSPRFDANCKSDDAMPGAPEAGQWFTAHFLDMVKNANPGL